MLDFTRMLNINNKNRESEIRNIVRNEIDNIKNMNGSYDGICKLMANNIKYELNKLGIKSYYVDLNDYGVDHVALIVEFYDNELKRYLVDPTILNLK